MDSVVCRELHILLARVDPVVSDNSVLQLLWEADTDGWRCRHIARMWDLRVGVSVSMNRIKRGISIATKRCLESLRHSTSFANLSPILES